MGDKEGRTAPKKNVFHSSSHKGINDASRMKASVSVAFNSPEHNNIGDNINLPSSKPIEKPNEREITEGSVVPTKETNGKD